MTQITRVPHQSCRRLTAPEARRLHHALAASRQPRPTVWQGLLLRWRTVWNELAERRRIRRDEAYLAEMSPHLLRDIGLARLETGRFARFDAGR